MPLVSTSETRAVPVDLVIQQGADFEHVVSVQNSNGSVFSLVGYSARMQIRATKSSALPLLDLTTVNGRLVINGAAGQVTITLTNAETTLLLFDSGVYDLEIVSPAAKVSRIIAGNVTVSLEITR